MSDLILHHYPMSPFSEKIRVMLGYTGLDWQSVITREMPPRPQLAILAGGYRKIPVAQIGADIFCDTRTIAAEIATLSGKPRLALEKLTTQQQGFASEVDLEVFIACAMAASTRAMGRKFRQSLSVADMARFIWDRLNFGLPVLSLRAARQRVRLHLESLERMLKQPFLFGKQPNHADFSTYHSLWFLRDLAESSLLDDYPQTLAWMDRMQAFGHGGRREISAQQALDIAREATPRAIAAVHRKDPQIGQQVRITPSDYGQVATSGKLVGATPTRWILARDVAEVGSIHLHFPKQGFTLAPD
ncbi:Glutathione S-transferase [Pseudomonas pohangensis]|uniref:Glutathione S-transferase n=1 Tax=Pseudomonas pohangensis TaxID=364197 RepID=A0A1H2F2J8_9PSED|nr:glutathione S-transferase family protein [Pseudomonas pohangensis]SDU01557.1 Glutathione S-transferase [Pseudomonas pohangensis]